MSAPRMIKCLISNMTYIIKDQRVKGDWHNIVYDAIIPQDSEDGKAIRKDGVLGFHKNNTTVRLLP